ncbi:hypothetical protein HN51_066890 [Arachis hypogaea]
MEDTKTSFHTEIGSTGVEPDSLSLKKKKVMMIYFNPPLDHQRTTSLQSCSSLFPLSNTFLFVPDTFYLPPNSLLCAQLHTYFFNSHEFTDRIRLHTGGANLSVEACFGGLHRCRDSPCQRCPDSIANTNLCGVRNTG